MGRCSLLCDRVLLVQGMSDETRLEFIENTKKAKIAARLQFSFELDAGVLDLLHQQGYDFGRAFLHALFSTW